MRLYLFIPMGTYGYLFVDHIFWTIPAQKTKKLPKKTKKLLVQTDIIVPKISPWIIRLFPEPVV